MIITMKSISVPLWPREPIYYKPRIRNSLPKPSEFQRKPIKTNLKNYWNSCGNNAVGIIHSSDVVCHQGDGRSFYGPMPDSTFVDAGGGWHDAGDQLKYLITGSYATAHMLKAYELFPTTFDDNVNHLGQPIPNNIADVLDEAKWGLDWILKLHGRPDQLIHQIADDRDHRGWKMPDEDDSDYGWGA